MTTFKIFFMFDDELMRSCYKSPKENSTFISVEIGLISLGTFIVACALTALLYLMDEFTPIQIFGIVLASIIAVAILVFILQRHLSTMVDPINHSIAFNKIIKNNSGETRYGHMHQIL